MGGVAGESMVGVFFDGFVRSLKAYSPQTYGWWARYEPATMGLCAKGYFTYK
jgi:hypothetical protein